MTVAGTEEAKAQWAPVPYRQFFIAFGTATFFGVVFFAILLLQTIQKKYEWQDQKDQA